MNSAPAPREHKCADKRWWRQMEAKMNKFLPPLAAAALIASATAGSAESSTVQRTPGHENQVHHHAGTPGASYYAPGHEKKRAQSRSAKQLTPSR
jgi:hypothetical protein